MFFISGLSNYSLAFFHLWNHAFFKALLFLSAGALIHAFFDEQDIRRISAAREVVPFIYICFVIGSFAIMGFPFLTGYYSKDLILEFTYSRYIINATFVYFLGITSAICTAIYSFRMLYFVFSPKTSSNGFVVFYKHFSNDVVECSGAMFLAMFCLAFASIIIGYVSSDLINGVGIMY